MKTTFGHPIHYPVSVIRKLAIKLAHSKENLPYTPLSTRTTGVSKGMIPKWKWL